MIKFWLSILLILSSLSISCVRQTLEEPFQFVAHVPITIDWSESLLKEDNIANVAIYAFPLDGRAPIKILSDNIHYNVLQLPIGEYAILIHNELLGDVKGLENSSANDFNEIRSHIIQMEKPVILYDTLRVNDIVAEPHNIISTWAMRRLVVDSEMVELTRSENTPTKGNEKIDVATKALESLSRVYPQCENTVLHFNIRVENLNNAMKVEALLRGTEYGAYLASDRREELENKRVVYANILRNRVFDDPKNGKDGYMSLTVNTFGTGDTNDRYYLDLSCALNSGRVMKFSFDITNKILEGGNSKYITINMGTIDEPAIVLPPSSDAGFNVGDWDDEIIVDIL